MYRKPTITESQKAAAHNLYANEPNDGNPKSDYAQFASLPSLTSPSAAPTRQWNSDELQTFAREAGLSYYEINGSNPAPKHTPVASPLAPAVAAPTSAPKYRPANDMAGQLTDRATILDYIRAGNATITVVSKASGTRFTFKFQRPKGWTPGPQQPVAPVFCKVLTGSDNESDYAFAGTMWPENGMFPDGPQKYRHSQKSSMTFNAKSVQALSWFINAINGTGEKLAQCEVWHEGRCGRCGRKLTVPTSVESGYGPECIGKLGM